MHNFTCYIEYAPVKRNKTKKYEEKKIHVRRDSNIQKYNSLPRYHLRAQTGTTRGTFGSQPHTRGDDRGRRHTCLYGILSLQCSRLAVSLLSVRINHIFVVMYGNCVKIQMLNNVVICQVMSSLITLFSHLFIYSLVCQIKGLHSTHLFTSHENSCFYAHDGVIAPNIRSYRQHQLYVKINVWRILVARHCYKKWRLHTKKRKLKLKH